MDGLIAMLLHVLTALALAGGLFFMFVGAVGIIRLPDVYCRSHASSKCVTLGIIGLLAALVFFVAALGNGDAGTHAVADATEEATAELEVEKAVIGEAPGVVALTKALLVIAFIFTAAPIGAHMLARAAHLAKVQVWPGTIDDELADDEAAPDPPATGDATADRL